RGGFTTLRVTPEGDGRILHVELNRPEKRNAMNAAFWREMVECFQDIEQDPTCRAVVISGAGKIFTAVPGDLLGAGEGGTGMGRGHRGDQGGVGGGDTLIPIPHCPLPLQCPKPVIAAVHGACVGAGELGTGKGGGV
ncbi:ECH1 protein, partial [Jacana jacana]|nr:ECH1 protein [Jacana jacana]